jgi:hypothetical protein
MTPSGGSPTPEHLRLPGVAFLWNARGEEYGFRQSRRKAIFRVLERL